MHVSEKNTICPFCGKQLKKCNGHHKCEEKQDFLNESFLNELKKLYIDKEYSIFDLGVYFNEKYKNIIFSKIPDCFFRKIVKEHLKEQYRGIKDSTNTKKIREKYKNTMISTYGYSHNFNKGCESRIKWEKRLFEEEGITNVFQRESVKEKIHETLLKRYGTDDEIKKMRGYFSTRDGFKEKYGDDWESEWERYITYKRTMSKDFYIKRYGKNWEEKWKEHIKNISVRFNGIHFNGLNEKCYELLSEFDIVFETEFPLQRPEKYKKIIGGELFFYDFKINNLLIELNGTYWHCDPRKYKETDIVKFPNNEMKCVKDVWFKDRCKKRTAIDNGYFFEVIWEDDFNRTTLVNVLKKYNLWNK